MELYIRLDISHMQGFEVAEVFEKLAHDFRTAADSPRTGDSGKLFDLDGDAIGIWAVISPPH